MASAGVFQKEVAQIQTVPNCSLRDNDLRGISGQVKDAVIIGVRNRYKQRRQKSIFRSVRAFNLIGVREVNVHLDWFCVEPFLEDAPCVFCFCHDLG
jgi:hypothetical protein